MPAKSQAQFKFMQGISHGMKPMKSLGPSKKTAKEFVDATPDMKKLPKKLKFGK